MATYPVEIPSRNMWAVIQSTSETMYAPTFDDELEANIFACFYSDRQPLAMMSETAQVELAHQIRVFLDELAPRAPSISRGERILPLDWQRALDSRWDEEDHEEGDKPCFEEYELLESFENYGSKTAHFVMDAFAAWRTTHQPKPKYPAYDVYACGHSYPTSAPSGTVYHRRCGPCERGVAVAS